MPSKPSTVARVEGRAWVFAACGGSRSRPAVPPRRREGRAVGFRGRARRLAISLSYDRRQAREAAPVRGRSDAGQQFPTRRPTRGTAATARPRQRPPVANEGVIFEFGRGERGKEAAPRPSLGRGAVLTRTVRALHGGADSKSAAVRDGFKRLKQAFQGASAFAFRGRRGKVTQVLQSARGGNHFPDPVVFGRVVTW